MLSSKIIVLTPAPTIDVLRDVPNVPRRVVSPFYSISV
jgi:hypothetical protein